MALKTKTHDIEKVSAVQRTVQAASVQTRTSPDAVVLQRAKTSQPSALRPNDVLALQRTVGNRAVQQILQHGRRSTIQTKLAVGPANDHYEREADRVAASVMSESAAPRIQRQGLEDEDETIQTKSLASSITPLIQRQELNEEEEDPIQTKLLASSTIQRQEAPDEEEEENPVQLCGEGGQHSVMPGVEHGIERARGGGQPLPGVLLKRMESSFGTDFSGVRVHADSESDSLNHSLHARAFTTGHDLFFRRGEYNPDSSRGQELIAHELTHVVQQNGGKSGKRNLSLKRIIQRDPLDEERGFFNADPTGPYGNIPCAEGPSKRRENYNKDDKRDLATYALMGLGATSAVAKAVTDKVAVAADVGLKPLDWITESTSLASETGKGLSGLGVAGAGLGTVSSLVDTYKGVRDYRDTSATAGQQRIGLAAGASGLASATHGAATTTFHAANLVGNTAMAATAQTVAGGAGVATGAVDILRGVYSYRKAGENVFRLQQLQHRRGGLPAGISKAAQQAESTQQLRQSTAKWTVAKGVLTVVGGSLLVATAATPVGWLLLGAGAILGAIGAYRKYKDKKKRAEEIAIRELGVEEDMELWLNLRDDVEKRTWKWFGSRDKEMARLGPSPLDKKLKELGFISVGHFYANFIHKTANNIYDMGVTSRERLEAPARAQIAASGGSPSQKRQALARLRGMSSAELPPQPGNPHHVVEQLLAGMGLKFDFRQDPPEPKPEKIGKALHD